MKSMFFPQQKKEENIAEYLLYIWQVEDLIRSCNFDINLVEDIVLNSYFESDNQKHEAHKWYSGMVAEMNNKKLIQKGHIEEVYELIAELNFLHNALLTVFQDKTYIDLYEKAGDNINELRRKSNRTAKTDIEASLNGLYGVLVLRMQKKEIHPDTMDAIKTISSLIAYLSAKYKLMRSGKLNFPVIKNN